MKQPHSLLALQDNRLIFDFRPLAALGPVEQYLVLDAFNKATEHFVLHDVDQSRPLHGEIVIPELRAGGPLDKDNVH